MPTTICKLPHLPPTANDGDEICDKYGNRWKFDGPEDGWISLGAITSQATVTENNNGIITPTIFTQLAKVNQYVKTNPTQQPLKILPGTDAYWYYLRSSDKSIKFKPEAEDVLRIEIDKSRLFKIISKGVCGGPVGYRGDAGPRGFSGASGPAEVCYQPAISGKQLDFVIFTPAPLVDRTDIVLPNDHVPDISVRLFPVTFTAPKSLKVNRKKIDSGVYDQLQYLPIHYHSVDEVLSKFQVLRNRIISQSFGATDGVVCDKPLSDVLVLPSDATVDSVPSVTVLIDPLGVVAPRITFDSSLLSIDVAASIATISYDHDTHLVCGSLILTGRGTWSGSWCVKSRQMGPDGVAGEPGEQAVKIVECQLDSSNVIAVCPVVNSRFDCDNKTIYTLCDDIVSTICVDQVKLLAGAGSLSDKTGIDVVLASAQMTLDECKLIYRYKPVLAEDEFGDLELPYWDPQPGCVSKHNYDNQIFDWVLKTSSATCDPLFTWYDAAMEPRPGTYPNTITIAKEPATNECCADEFFYCPNIQDGGCPPSSPASSSLPPEA